MQDTKWQSLTVGFNSWRKFRMEKAPILMMGIGILVIILGIIFVINSLSGI